MDVSTVACNICHRIKKETNHWLVVILRPGFEGIIFQPAESALSPRNPDLLYEDVCGHACAHARLSRWLEDLKDAYTPTESEAA